MQNPYIRLLFKLLKFCLGGICLNIEDIPNNITEYNSGLLSLNNFLIEQAEINEYAHLVKFIISQLDRFLKPVYDKSL